MMIHMKLLHASLFCLMVCAMLACGTRSTDSQTAGDAQVETDTIDYLERGRTFAAATQAVLGRNLTDAINRDGVEHALSFCQLRAHPLTDSLARELGAGIRRVTDKPRNPANQANEEELAYIALLKADIAAGRTLTTMLKENDETIVGYYPIMTNALCLACHGQPGTDIASATFDRIRTLYRNDQATGYGLDELRGLWVVEMTRQ